MSRRPSPSTYARAARHVGLLLLALVAALLVRPAPAVAAPRSAAYDAVALAQLASVERVAEPAARALHHGAEGRAFDDDPVELDDDGDDDFRLEALLAPEAFTRDVRVAALRPRAPRIDRAVDTSREALDRRRSRGPPR